MIANNQNALSSQYHMESNDELDWELEVEVLLLEFV